MKSQSMLVLSILTLVKMTAGQDMKLKQATDELLGALDILPPNEDGTHYKPYQYAQGFYSMMGFVFITYF